MPRCTLIYGLLYIYADICDEKCEVLVMPMVVVRNDITRIEADAIVNPANRRLAHGNGTSDAIFQRAGSEKLEKACRALGTCEPGCAVATEGLNLSYAGILFMRWGLCMWMAAGARKRCCAVLICLP